MYGIIINKFVVIIIINILQIQSRQNSNNMLEGLRTSTTQQWETAS